MSDRVIELIIRIAAFVLMLLGIALIFKQNMIPDIVIAAWSIGLFVIAYIVTKKKQNNDRQNRSNISMDNSRDNNDTYVYTAS